MNSITQTTGMTNIPDYLLTQDRAGCYTVFCFP